MPLIFLHCSLSDEGHCLKILNHIDVNYFKVV